MKRTILLLEGPEGPSNQIADLFRGGLKSGVEVLNYNELISRNFNDNLQSEYAKSGQLSIATQMRLILSALDSVGQPQPTASRQSKTSKARAPSRGQKRGQVCPVTVTPPPQVQSLSDDMPPDAPTFYFLQGFDVTEEWIKQGTAYGLALGGSVRLEVMAAPEETKEAKPAAKTKPQPKRPASKKDAKKPDPKPSPKEPAKEEGVVELPKTVPTVMTALRALCVQQNPGFLMLDVPCPETLTDKDALVVGKAVACALRDHMATRAMYDSWTSALKIIDVAEATDDLIDYRAVPEDDEPMVVYNNLMDLLPDEAATPVTCLEAMLRQVTGDQGEFRPGDRPEDEGKRFAAEAGQAMAAACVPFGMTEDIQEEVVREAMPRVAGLLDPKSRGAVSVTSGAFDRTIALRELLSFLTDRTRSEVMPSVKRLRPGDAGFEMVTRETKPEAEPSSEDSGVGLSTVMDIQTASQGPSMMMSDAEEDEGVSTVAGEGNDLQATRVVNIQHIILLLALHDSLKAKGRSLFMDTQESADRMRHLVAEYTFGLEYTQVHDLFWRMFMSETEIEAKGGMIDACFDPIGMRLVVIHDPAVPDTGKRAMGFYVEKEPEAAFATVPSLNEWACIHRKAIAQALDALFEKGPKASKPADMFAPDKIRVLVAKTVGSPLSKYVVRGDSPPSCFYRMGPVPINEAAEKYPDVPEAEEPEEEEDEDEATSASSVARELAADDPARLIPEDVTTLFPCCSKTTVSVANRTDGNHAQMTAASDGVTLTMHHTTEHGGSAVAKFADSTLVIGPDCSIQYASSGVVATVSLEDMTVKLTSKAGDVAILPDGSQHTLSPVEGTASLYEDGTVVQYGPTGATVTLPSGIQYMTSLPAPTTVDELVSLSAQAISREDVEIQELPAITVARTRDRLTDAVNITRRDMVGTVTVGTGVSVTQHADQTRITLSQVDEEAGQDVPGYTARGGYASVTVEHPLRNMTADFISDGEQRCRKMALTFKNRDTIIVRADIPIAKSRTARQHRSFTLIREDGTIVTATKNPAEPSAVIKVAPRGTTRAHKILIDQYNTVSDQQNDLEQKSRMFNTATITTPPRVAMSERKLARVMLGEELSGETDPYVAPILRLGIHHARLMRGPVGEPSLVYHLTDFYRNVAIVSMDGMYLNSEFLGPHVDKGQEAMQEEAQTPELLKNARNEDGKDAPHTPALPVPDVTVSGVTDGHGSVVGSTPPPSGTMDDDQTANPDEQSGYDMESGYSTESDNDFDFEDAPMRMHPMLPGISLPVGGDNFPGKPYLPPTVPATEYIEIAPHPGALYTRPRLFVVPLADIERFLPEPSESSTESSDSADSRSELDDAYSAEFGSSTAMPISTASPAAMPDSEPPVDPDELGFTAQESAAALVQEQPESAATDTVIGTEVASYVDYVWRLYALSQAQERHGLRVVVAPIGADQEPMPCRLGLLLPHDLDRTTAELLRQDGATSYSPYRESITAMIPLSMRLGPVVDVLRGQTVRRGTTRTGARPHVSREEEESVYSCITQHYPVFDDHLLILHEAMAGYSAWKEARDEQQQLMTIVDPRAEHTVSDEAMLRLLLAAPQESGPIEPEFEHAGDEEAPALFPDEDDLAASTMPMPDEYDRALESPPEPVGMEPEPSLGGTSYFHEQEGKSWRELGDRGFAEVVDHFDLEATRLGIPTRPRPRVQPVTADIQRQSSAVLIATEQQLPKEVEQPAQPVERLPAKVSIGATMREHEANVLIDAAQSGQSIAEPNVGKLVMEGNSTRMVRTVAANLLTKKDPNRIYHSLNPTPSKLSFGSIKVGKTYQIPLKITNTGIQTVRVRVTSPPPMTAPIAGQVWVDWTPGPIPAGLHKVMRIGVTTVDVGLTEPTQVTSAISVVTATEILAIPVTALIHPADTEPRLSRNVKTLTNDAKLQSTLQQHVHDLTATGPSIPSSTRNWREQVNEIDVEQVRPQEPTMFE
ncbi:hypothetical protein J8273_1156 [Carpediemonas membranifera]|uniref:Uncharacterized protein n=1 Tax=Carpediemonas membranifera TaxID=201153 RepID=A0A8J6E4Q5_9EUKA|nr:hypothetical protein J8273_1156 [Carpediemonas membranifera]|eukprot:KAG9397241.1 hypothetical protein J8273_1156 [Carpediemonas membranifera]